MPKDRKINWTILYYIGSLLIVLIVNAFLIYYTNNKKSEFNDRIISTQLIRYALLDIESSLFRGWDIGMRGYAVTGVKDMLNPFYDAYDYKVEVFERLKNETIAIDQPLGPVDSLDRVVHQYGEYMAGLKNLFDSAGLEVFKAELSRDHGYTAWVAYNSQVVQIKENIDAELARIEREENFMLQTTLFVQMVSMLLALVILILIYRTIVMFAKEKRAYIDEIGKVNEMLTLHQENLENEVARKTEDLAKTNLELKSTIDNMKVMQSQMLQSEKMASLGTLTTGIAHEFNNALNFVKGGYQVALDLFDKATDKVSRVKETGIIKASIEQGVGRMEKIVGSLQIFSNRDSQDVQTTDINELINNSLVMLSPKIRNEIRIEKKLKLNRNLVLNKANIQHVLLQLIDNALDAVDQKNNADSSIIVKTYSNDEWAVINIQNNGPRISEEHLRSIFDPFFTTKDPGKGTGLGLSVCYSIITECEGKIYAENKGDMVSFTVELPLAGKFVLTKS